MIISGKNQRLVEASRRTIKICQKKTKNIKTATLKIAVIKIKN